MSALNDGPNEIRLGVLVPETNTTLRTDFAALSRVGTDGMMVDIVWEPLSMGSGLQADDAQHAAVIAAARASAEAASRRLARRGVDVVVMGFVVETFWGGREGSVRTIARLREASGGVPVISGGDAALAALDLLGARRIGLVTPYQPAADEHVKRFFEESGYVVAGITGLRAPSAAAIAEIDGDRLGDAVRKLAAKGVDAVVQIGTNISILDQIEGLETVAGCPVLGVNALLYQHALRSVR
jgi:maleate isomerase